MYLLTSIIILLIPVKAQHMIKYSTEEFGRLQAKIYPIVKISITEETEPIIKYKENEGPIFEKIGGDLLLFFGLDRESYYELVSYNDFPPEITLDTLKKLAINNLIELVGDNIQLSNTNFGGKMLTCGYNFESSLILVDQLWDNIRINLGYEFVLAIPAKDLLLIAKKEDTTEIKKLKQSIDEIHKDGEFLLSKKIFTLTKGLLKEYIEN
jgi:uncharacterized protein YtpQ (UPF0354 family)